MMYIEIAVLTVFCLWFTDRSCFGWTRPSAGVHFSSERAVSASHPVGPMCPGTLSRSFHIWWNSKLTLWNSKTLHMYTYFYLEAATQELPTKQCTLPRAEGRDFASALVSGALVVQLHLLLKFWK